jgi:Leucine-rich repeat (LRR) protein
MRPPAPSLPMTLGNMRAQGVRSPPCRDGFATMIPCPRSTAGRMPPRCRASGRAWCAPAVGCRSPESNRSGGSLHCSASTYRERGLPTSNRCAGSRRLQSLDLAQTPVISLEPLRALTALQSLDVSGTKVPSLEPVYDLPDLHIRNAGNIAETVLNPFIEHRKERQLPQ